MRRKTLAMMSMLAIALGYAAIAVYPEHRAEAACHAARSYVDDLTAGYAVPPKNATLYEGPVRVVFDGDVNDPKSSLSCRSVQDVLNRKNISYGKSAVANATNVPSGDTFRSLILSASMPKIDQSGRSATMETRWLASGDGGETKETTMKRGFLGTWQIAEQRTTTIY